MRFSYYRRPLFLLLALYAGGLFLLRGRVLKPPARLPFDLPRNSVPVQGRVAEYPAAAPGGERFELRVTSVYGAPLDTSLMVRAKAGLCSYGDAVSFIGELSEPRGARAPGGLDWGAYLARRGVEAEARALDLGVERPAPAPVRLARAWRARALRAFDDALGPEAGAVMGGVVLGEKRAVPPELKAAFRDSGAMHLLVASGSNVGFIVAVVYFICSRLRLGRRWSGAAALGLAGFYVLSAGLDTPLVRAYLMFAAGLAAWVFRREAGAFHALTAAALFVLAVSPRSLFDAGFQMSFLAAYGLTVGMAAWGRYLPGGWAGRAGATLLVSLCAQLCLYPLLAYYFHRVSLVSPLSNMLLVPASGLAMASGFLLAGAYGTALFAPLAKLSSVFFAFFIKTVKFFAALPFASVNVPEPSGWTVAGGLLLALVLLHAPLAGFRGRWLYACAFAGLLLVSAGPLRRAAAAPGYGATLFGDANTSCVLARTPAGLFLVNPGLGGRDLADAVLAAGSTELRGVLLTSAEPRNFSGLGELARRVKVRNLFLPYGPRPPALGRVIDSLGRSGTPTLRLWPGESAGAGLKVSCRWDGRGAGYTGSGDSFGWDIGGLRVAGGGGWAGLHCGGAGCAAEAAGARGTTTELATPGR